jgi:predicted acylesterase/phospholipase RssA
MAANDNTIGVAISGGGHRASLFGLGALLYLIDADKGRQLGSVASVSGGSITNAFIGGVTDLTSVTRQEMWHHARTLASQIVRRGTLWAAPLTYVYLLTIALLLIAAVVIGCCYPWWAIVAAWVIAVALGGWLSQQRSAVVAKAFDATVFHGAKLADMHQSVSHVLCATDLQTGQHVFFSSGFVYAWRTGWGTPGDLRAARATQASAALPGAFSVVSLPVSRFGLPEQRVVTADRNPPRRFKLLDGGVYDNMASEWILDIDETRRDGTPPTPIQPVTEAIVVNASAGDDVVDRPWVKVPFVGEINSLLAVKDVMYQQTTAVRRRLLNVRYQIAQDEAKIQPHARVLQNALPGTTVQINRSPFEIPDDFHRGSDDFAARAASAIEWLGDENRQHWAAEADANRRVKTTLSRIDSARALSLIRHGYVLTMINCHVLLGYPLRDMPDAAEFASLVAAEH